MKKRLLILSLCLSVGACALGLTACGHEHKYTDVITAPTCTTLGYTVHTCECGDRYTDAFIANLGHNFTSYISNDDATCTEDGTKTATCDRDGCSVTDTITDTDTMIDHIFSNGKCNMCNASDGLVYELTEDAQGYVVTDKGSFVGGNLVIPRYHKKKPVTSIGDYAFAHCSSLTSVTIGDSAESIGDYAFYNCSSLTSVTIPDSVESVGDEAFYNCSSLTSVTIPDSVESIGDWAFSSCDSLTSVTIGDSVESIGDFAFFSCGSLTSVTIGDSVESIGSSAFANCGKLSSVIFSDTSTWYYTSNFVNFISKTGGAQFDVTNPSTAADKLNDYDAYSGYYWYKK